MRIQAIFKRILLQRRGDKRSLGLLFVAPLIILGLMYLLLQVPSNVTYRVGIDNQTTSAIRNLPQDAQLSSQLAKNDKLKLFKVDNANRSTLNDKNLDAVVVIQDHKIEITYANRDTGKTQAISAVVNMLTQATQGKIAQGQTQTAIADIIEKAEAAAQTATKNAVQNSLKAAANAAVQAGAHPQAMQQATENIAQEAAKNAQTSASASNKPALPTIQAPTITSHYLYGTSSLNPFDNLAPVLVSFFVFFFVFLISGISLVNERTSGTLTRMLVTPVKRSEIVAGYTLAYGLLAVVQTTLVVLWARYVLQMQVLGNFGWVLLINLLIALIALLMGLALSAFSKTEFQFVQFIPIAIVPQFLFSGIINVDTMSQPLQWLAHIMPLYYGVDALQKVIKQGMGIGQIDIDLAVLFAIVILLYFINVFALKSIRRT